jgi:predicted amidohydrolase YtcJ
MLKLVAVKAYLDGGMLTGSAFMSKPWGVSEIYRISDPTYCGLQFIPDDKLARVVEQAYDHGFQFVAHCQGDAAIDALLRAYEALDRKHPIRERRLCIGHGSFMRLDLVRRAARIGVVADSQPAWLYSDASVLLRQFGAERLRYFIPVRTWFAEGGIVAGGSDHMIGYDPAASINIYSPFWGMWIAVTRRAKWVDEPVIPEEAASREQAIRLYTTNAAFVEFAEKEKGSLEAGKLADCIVIDRDILACPADEIRDAQVERTYVGGKLVYAR